MTRTSTDFNALVPSRMRKPSSGGGGIPAATHDAPSLQHTVSLAASAPGSVATDLFGVGALLGVACLLVAALAWMLQDLSLRQLPDEVWTTEMFALGLLVGVGLVAVAPRG